MCHSFRLSCVVAALLCGAVSGCAPHLVVLPPQPMSFAQPGPAVRVLPFRDPRPAPQHVSTGYQGIFQVRQDVDAHPDTPPASVLSQALAEELIHRGLTATQAGQYEVGCQIDQFLLRYRNYAGALSATDGWGYLDLICRVTSAGQTVWEGPVHARHHRVFYVMFKSIPDGVWPELSGALVQQVAAVLNRTVFHQAASPKLVQEATANLASGDPDKRYQGAYALGVTGDPAMVPVLLRYLSDPEKKVRRAVVDAIGTLGATEALPALLRSFDGEDGNVQWAIIKDILQLGDPAGFAWLRQRAPSLKQDTLKEIADDVLAHDTQPRAAR